MYNCSMNNNGVAGLGFTVVVVLLFLEKEIVLLSRDAKTTIYIK